jgi:hypothetical protein
MIIVKVMGGLGNQMFQFALGKSIEQQKSYCVKYDLTYYNRIPDGDTPRKPYILNFCDDSYIASEVEIRQVQGKAKSRIGNVFRKLSGQENRITEEDNDDSTKEFVDQLEDNRYLIGYWQNECYFKNIERSIRETFDFSSWKLDVASQKRLNEIKTSEHSTSIHVRAGDYLSEQNRKTFGDICTSDYYRRACDYILNKYPETVFYLFSNDVEWTKTHIELPYDRTVIVSSSLDTTEDWEEMFLMSSCKNNIIANSSYSWWGGWLNTNPQKTVISPSRWQNGNDNAQIICKEWITI